ncbi:hypothetical protein GVN18_06495 [Pseudomonas sp. ODNR1LW]|nr:hypothetical protein [Pseudomonas sp. ODNR1LW]
MYNETKLKAFSAFHDLLVAPEIRMNAQEQYEELLKLADDFGAKGIINLEERRSLIEVATMTYARAVEGAGAGT